jgi:hypothetical protein
MVKFRFLLLIIASLTLFACNNVKRDSSASHLRDVDTSKLPYGLKRYANSMNERSCFIATNVIGIRMTLYVKSGVRINRKKFVSKAASYTHTHKRFFHQLFNDAYNEIYFNRVTSPASYSASIYRRCMEGVGTPTHVSQARLAVCSSMSQFYILISIARDSGASRSEVVGKFDALMREKGRRFPELSSIFASIIELVYLSSKEKDAATSYRLFSTCMSNKKYRRHREYNRENKTIEL